MRTCATFILASLSLSCLAIPDDPNIFVPPSSMDHSPGRAAHTNHLIYIGPPIERTPSEGGLMPLGVLSGPAGYHPSDIRAAYSLPSTGGSGAIAVVVAYHYPTARKDFNTFSATFGLPKETSTNLKADTNKVLELVFASGTRPVTNGGWAQEAAMDIQWTHAIAPNAKIYLVEAATNSYADMFAAVRKASKLPGVKQVSMSWGGSEFSGETNFDGNMITSGVVYFASSGDNGGVRSYPAVSPNVVGVGGTSLTVDASGTLISEKAWSGSGGGPSAYQPRPVYQNVIQSIVSGKRGSPDVSAVADPYTGASVYCTTEYLGNTGWMVFGGTSLSAPIVAGMANLSGTTRTSSIAQNTRFYNGLGGPNFRDITKGASGAFYAKAGWDYTTGIGVPVGLAGF